LKLIKNPDILAELGGNRKGNKRPLLIGFALETENLLAQVQDKLRSKNVDMIVGNLASESIGHDQNTAVIATQRGHVELARMPKDQLAHRILDEIKTLEGNALGKRSRRSLAPN